MTRKPSLFALYRVALRLYPRHLRLRYQDQMLQTLRDAHAELTVEPIWFWIHAFTDLLQSSIKEHMLMTRDEVIRRPIFFHAVTLGLILTVMGGASALTFQQMLRRGADQPQLQMVQHYASELSAGRKPEQVLPAARIDLEESLEPFATFYNDHGVPIASTATLNQAIPVPPPGVFEHVRSHGSERVTWQPQPGVRVASVIQRIEGTNPGYLLAGRSLRVVEQQESLFWRMVFIAWFVLVALLIAGAWFLTRAQFRHATV